MRCRAVSCFNAALTFLCRFLRPFPRFGPSIEIGSARRCFRAACFSARTFSRFLSRFLNVLIEDLSRVPYTPINLSNCPDDTYVMKCSSSNFHEIHRNVRTWVENFASFPLDTRMTQGYSRSSFAESIVTSSPSWVTVGQDKERRKEIRKSLRTSFMGEPYRAAFL
jgi:hypothetical protein